MDIKSKINAILYQYQDKITSGYGVKLLRFYCIEEEFEKLLKSELKECYKDVKGINGKYSNEEFEAWFDYKYKH